MSTHEVYKIRPAGRHILTIGRDLIQDSYAAIVELVKNAYDADSPDVKIEFKVLPDGKHYTISIEDHGHGMTRNTVINKWMVPSTDDKLTRNKSPGGRVMQGRKGIGRYAASILGDDLLLETLTPDGDKTTVYIEWKIFENAQFLDDVEILIETAKTSSPSGTRLTITGGIALAKDWDRRYFDTLKYELKKLIPPIDPDLAKDLSSDTFKILLNIDGFFIGELGNLTEEIKPFPIFGLFDYRICGRIHANGKGILTYSSQKARNIADESIPFDGGGPTDCGELDVDIRVFDREKESIDSLVGRGLKNESGEYVSNLQARQLLNQFNGVGVFRNGFRIRPLGDPDFDWLKLNEQRIQNPSLRISSNQVIGFVKIQSEELSALSEKSARDGLKENWAFYKLKKITGDVISRLEARRFEYRRRAGLSKPTLKLERELERLFAFDDLKRGVRAKLEKGGIDKSAAEEIINIISKDEQEKIKLVEDIRRAVAVYQGQATLGKIINYILHEGRRPLNYFKNQIPNINFIYDQLLREYRPDLSNRFIHIASGIGQNAETFVKLFGRLDPLASGRRADKVMLPLKSTIVGAFGVFESELKVAKIAFNVSGPGSLKFLAWQQDIYAIITNLIDNSVYWIKEKKSKQREINIAIIATGEDLNYIDYRDTGPGIDTHLIETQVIFEPEFSTKPGGHGLGLAIAGEAAARNGLELKAFESEAGAYFRLQPKNEG